MQGHAGLHLFFNTYNIEVVHKYSTLRKMVCSTKICIVLRPLFSFIGQQMSSNDPVKDKLTKRPLFQVLLEKCPPMTFLMSIE